MAYDLNGTTNFLEYDFATDWATLSALSILFWADFDGWNASENHRVFDARDDAGFVFDVQFNGTNKDLQAVFNLSTLFMQQIGDELESFYSGVHHWAITWTGGTTQATVKMYRDGIELSYGTGSDGTGTPTDAIDQVTIGDRTQANGSAFHYGGGLWDMAIYDHVIGAERLAALAAGGNPLSGGLLPIANWPLGPNSHELISNTAEDGTGSATKIETARPVDGLAWPVVVTREAAAVSGRIMSSLAASGGLAGRGGIAGQGGGLAA